MEKELKIAQLISTDVRSRLNADKIRNELNENVEKVILDFSGVTFMSRSFTDELYNIIAESDAVFERINMSGMVESMIDTVFEGRRKERVRKVDDSTILSFEDVNSLCMFLVGSKS